MNHSDKQTTSVLDHRLVLDQNGGWGNLLEVDLYEGRSFVVQRGSMIYAKGPYKFDSEVNVRGWKKWTAKAFGKELVYNVYASPSAATLAFVPPPPFSLLCLVKEPDEELRVAASAHFGHEQDLQLDFSEFNLKRALREEPLLRVEGEMGLVVIKYLGDLVHLDLAEGEELVIDEEALLALKGNIKKTAIAKNGIKELLASGEGFLLSLRGPGKVILQTRTPPETGSGSGGVGSLFGWFN